MFSLPAGYLADRLGCRRLIYLAGLLLLLVATALFAFGRSILVLIVARVLQGMSAAIVWSVGFAMVLESVGKEKFGGALGAVYSFSTIAELTAPILGGILYDAVGISAVFAIAMGITSVDLIMRLLVIEHDVAKDNRGSNESYLSGEESESASHATENEPLLPRDVETKYKVCGDTNSWLCAMPVLYCFRNASFLMSMMTSFTQAMIISMFDATIPTEADTLLRFSSLQVGLLFIALVAPCTIFGWFCGRLVDKHGTKYISTIGYGFLAPCLALLGLPSQDVIDRNIKAIVYCIVLALDGVGLAIINLPGFVEASDVMKKYEAANPALFGDHGCYAQLYGFNSFFFFSGLTAGPLVSGFLKDHLGYGGMGIGFGIASAAVAILSYMFMGEDL
ncbi:membrane transporter [Fusarium proliferatum]|nr:membrane transporter [Fusarium proliferatum]